MWMGGALGRGVVGGDELDVAALHGREVRQDCFSGGGRPALFGIVAVPRASSFAGDGGVSNLVGHPTERRRAALGLGTALAQEAAFCSRTPTEIRIGGLIELRKPRSSPRVTSPPEALSLPAIVCARRSN